MKYYIIAGEASGDLHASNLVAELKKLDNNVALRGWGGDLMITQGVNVIKHIKNLAFMGLADVIKNLGTILKNFKFCKADILSYNPDVLILVDYPGFNLRIAKFASQNGIKVFYYISPTVWAWHKSRISQIKKYVSRLFVILPFEKDFYKKHNYEVDYAGNPLLDEYQHFITLNVENTFKTDNNLSDKPIIAILPGSRKQEVKIMLPEMIKLIKLYPEYQFVIAGVNSLGKDFYSNYIKENEIKLIFGQTYNLLKNSYAAIVTSGTATLETAIFNIPQVVCYKTSPLTFYVARLFVNVKYLALINLILNKLAVKELIQTNFTFKNLKEEFQKITKSENYRAELFENYKLLSEELGGSGASKRTAELMYKYLTQK
ncbi:MAG: lipid-A-disaccharide synthase [Bacteroidetes bacterium GWA2_30_7]|nr:MAG: lipid-A-disaccharide synthase [Bacteroidetes bacterium GWA2_30_7]